MWWTLSRLKLSDGVLGAVYLCSGRGVVDSVEIETNHILKRVSWSLRGRGVVDSVEIETHVP